LKENLFGQDKTFAELNSHKNLPRNFPFVAFKGKSTLIS